MVNGEKMQCKLEFEEKIDGMSTTALLRYLAIMMYDHCDHHINMEQDIKNNKTRSYATMWVLIVLICVMIALGIIDSTMLGLL